MNFTNPAWLIVVAAGVAIVPMMLGITTSYLKVSVVFGLLKSALGTQQVPGTLVTMSLAMAVTTFVMAPVLGEMVARAAQGNWGDLSRPPTAATLHQAQDVLEPLRNFLTQHTGDREQEALRVLGGEPEAATRWRELLLGFVLTELKEAFMMGLMLLLPFLAVDLIVSNILVGLGMFMVSPTLISLPIKLLLFVLADGWLVLTRALITSYGGGV